MSCLVCYCAVIYCGYFCFDEGGGWLVWQWHFMVNLHIHTWHKSTTLAKCIWDLKLKHNVTPTLKWYILKSVASYSNNTKKCRLCLQGKFKILSYPNPEELLNKSSKLVSKCCHMKKFLSANYKVNDSHHTYWYLLATRMIPY